MNEKEKKTIKKIINDFKAKKKYLTVCSLNPNPVATEQYFLEQIADCDEKISALEKLFECQ